MAIDSRIEKIKQVNMISIGKIVSAHGTSGEVKLDSFAQNPEDIFNYQPLYTQDGKMLPKITRVSALNAHLFLTKIAGVRFRDETKPYLQKEVFIKREQLPELDSKSFYFADLMNLQVVDENGVLHGVITDVFDYGAGPFGVITTSEQKQITAFLNPESIISSDKDKIIIKNEYIIK